MSWAGDEGDRPRRPSQFLLEALDAPAVGTDVLRPSLIEKLERLSASRPRRALLGPQRRPALVEQPLNLSYGQVNDYTECPARYRYAHHPAAHAGQSCPRCRQGAPCRRAGLPSVADRRRAAHARGVAGGARPPLGVDGFVTVPTKTPGGRRPGGLDRFWDEQQADPSPVIGVEQEFAFRFDRTVAYRMDRSTAGRTGPWPWWTTSPATSATCHRRPPIAERLQLAIYAYWLAAEHGRPPDDLAHFLESAVGHSQATPVRLDKAPDRSDAADRAGTRGQSWTDALRVSPVPHDLPDAAR